jgi:hypothetical protein
MLHDLIDRQAEIQQKLDQIMSKEEALPSPEEIDASLEALKEASDEELERLLADPEMEKGSNVAVREQVIALLTERKGAAFVDELLARAKATAEPAALHQMAGGVDVDDDVTAERAREAFARYQNPLAEIIPDEVEQFVIDPQGNFYMRLESPTLLHLKDFDLMMEQEISGNLQPDRVTQVAGLTAMSQMDQELVQFRLLEFAVLGQEITIMTDHPLARVVHLLYADFLVVL